MAKLQIQGGEGKSIVNEENEQLNLKHYDCETEEPRDRRGKGVRERCNHSTEE